MATIGNPVVRNTRFLFFTTSARRFSPARPWKNAYEDVTSNISTPGSASEGKHFLWNFFFLISPNGDGLWQRTVRVGTRWSCNVRYGREKGSSRIWIYRIYEQKIVYFLREKYLYWFTTCHVYIFIFYCYIIYTYSHRYTYNICVFRTFSPVVDHRIGWPFKRTNIYNFIYKEKKNFSNSARTKYINQTIRARGSVL